MIRSERGSTQDGLAETLEKAFAKLREQAMLLAGCMHPPP